MSELTEAELKSKIKSDSMGAYLLYGDESYLVKVYTDRLIGLAVDESFRDFNLRIFEGDDASLPDIYDSVLSVPMMSPSKCVLVRDYPVDSMSDSDLKTLEMIVKDNPDDNCLIFSFAASAPRKNFKEVEKIFKAAGFATEFSRKQKSDLVKILENGAQKRSRSFGRGVADYMVTSVGTDLNMLSNELEKVCAYSDDVINYEDVDAVCIKSLETKVFDMIADLTAGKFDPAFRKLAKLFEQREDEYMILGALISQYIDMYRAKAVKNSGLPFSALGEYYKSYSGKSVYRLEKAARNCSTMSIENIRKCLDILAGADTAMKSTSADNKQILERTLVSLARADR